MLIGVQGSCMCGDFYDVCMAELYVHKIALSIVRRRVRGHVWIAKLSALWYARLCTTWSRHVVMCSEDDNGICTQLSVRMYDDWIVVALVLMQGTGRCRLVLF